MFRHAVLLLLLALVPALFTGWLHPRRPVWGEAFDPIPVVTVARLPSLPAAPALWIDAREADAFARGHVPGAINLNETYWESGLPAVIDAWSPEHRVIVYCDGGGCQSSRAVARRLRRELALTRIVILGDGWAALEPSGGKSAP